MTTINLICDDRRLAELINAARRSGWVAMDTEFLRERTYAPELCLIQAASEDFTACIDPLAIADLAPLAKLLADSNVVKLFHACRQDLEALDTRAPIHANNLYDTQLAAAFCGYGDQVSYAALVESVCSVRLPKSDTRTDWRRRPLSHTQFEYALDDVKYLQPLRQKLNRLLEQTGRIAWHRDECAHAVNSSHYRVDSNNAWRQLKGIDRLNAAGKACAQRLATWREQKARHRNLPRGWILPTPVLLEICRRRPDTPAKLAQIDAIRPGTVKNAGKQIIAMVIQSNNHVETDTATSAETPPLTSAQRQRVQAILHLLSHRAAQEVISRALLSNRRDVEQFVRGNTDLPLFRGWREQLVGAEILARFA